MMEWSFENNKNDKNEEYWRGACFPAIKNYCEAAIKHWDKHIS